MKLLLPILLALACASPDPTTAPAATTSPAAPAGSVSFDQHFTGATLRFDYFHSGSSSEEHVSLDGYRLEGEWPGSRVNLVDGTNLGKYLFKVVDPRTHAVIYSRGFASIYGEWETTGEAKTSWRVFHESQRFPEPRKTVQVILKKRGTDGAFREIYSGLVDPTSRFVDRSPVAPPPPATPGADTDRILASAGYSDEEIESLRDDGVI